MKKLISAILCLALALCLCCAGAEELMGVSEKTTIGTISVNGAFSLQCGLPEGYSVHPLVVNSDAVIASLSSADAAQPVMFLSIAFDETYSDVERLNDVGEDVLELLEKTYTDSDPTVEISYGETGLGTRLLIARQQDPEEMNYIDFLSIYKGYFVEFVMTPGMEAESGVLTDEQLRMCIDFLTDLDFIPVTEGQNEVNIAGQTFEARITGCNADTGMLTLELLDAVRLDEETVKSWAVGDTVTLGDITEQVETLEEDEYGLILNDYIQVNRQEDGTYTISEYERRITRVVKTVDAPMAEGFVFMDGIDAETMAMVEEPSVHTAEEFLKVFAIDDGTDPGFDADNVRVTFDGEGAVAVVDRFYTPWQ